MNSELFDKFSLKTALFCAILMAAIDGEFDLTERNACLSFLNEHWKKEYGSAKEFFLEVVADVKPYLNSRAMTNKKIDELAVQLSHQQKEKIITLIEKVMMADQQVQAAEMDLLTRFKRLKAISF